MRIVIALGGNALGKNPEEQKQLVKQAAKSIVDLVNEGHEIVISHGNGPQVGIINDAFDYSSHNVPEIPSMPFAECGAMSQGYIGYHLQQAIRNELNNRKINKDCITVITQVLVDEKDNAFSIPTKPIGLFCTKEEALKLKKEKNYTFIEDAGRGYRRVVPSPLPIKIIEQDSIVSLLSNGSIVIAAGGGGIPVVSANGKLRGISAVIDKDYSSSILASNINADLLLILTTVDKVSLNYNKKDMILLDQLNIDEIDKYIDENQFAKGSMLPKIEACKKFVINTNKQAIITSLLSADKALKGNNGTLIKMS